MGNHHCPPPKPLPNLIKLDKAQRSLAREVKPVTSYSNPSLVTLVETEHSSLHLSLSQTFNEENMNNIFSRFVEQERNDEASFIDQEVIKVIWNLIEALSVDDHVLFIATKFADKFYGNERFISAFAECSTQKPDLVSQFGNSNKENRIILHLIYYLRLHKYILTMFDDGLEEKALEILNLIALSHLIMKVDKSYFTMHTIQVIKSLLHFKLISEDQMSAFVYYNQTINNYIQESMDRYEQQLPQQIERIDELNSPARENYRELKKWKTVVLNTTKSLSVPLFLFQKQLQDETRKGGGGGRSAVDDVAEWKFIRMLKKGYKYKKKDISKTNVFSRTD